VNDCFTSKTYCAEDRHDSKTVTSHKPQNFPGVLSELDIMNKKLASSQISNTPVLLGINTSVLLGNNTPVLPGNNTPVLLGINIVGFFMIEHPIITSSTSCAVF
jgi:hypothetical protein